MMQKKKHKNQVSKPHDGCMRNVVTYSICLKYDDINSKESQIHGTEKEREKKCVFQANDNE